MPFFAARDCRPEANPKSQPSGPRRPFRLPALDYVTTRRAVRGMSE